MSFPVQFGITYLATVCVLLSYLLVTAHGQWRHAKWVGKATLLLLGWMTLSHEEEQPRLSEKKIPLDDTFVVASDVAREAFLIMKEQDRHGDID